ncbi:MAG: hypothetical protein IIA90_08435 [Chloroflexi bacterium]|nr:hypothetical protein [Chloroflexota bacterium]
MKRIIILGGVLAALAVGIVAVAGAGAQESTPEDRPADHYLELLADNLGITVEELEGALSQSHIDLVNEKVADGTITEEEAAEIIERIESGEGRLFPPFGGGQRGGHHGNFHRLYGLVVENSAEVLGMEVDALKEELHAGNSLADVATAQGVDVEQFKVDLLAAIAADLDEKVADGSITQEMADRILDKITESIDRIVEKAPGEGAPEGFGDGARSFGGPRHGGHGFRAPLGDTDGVEATTTNFLN